MNLKLTFDAKKSLDRYFVPSLGFIAAFSNAFKNIIIIVSKIPV